MWDTASTTDGYGGDSWHHSLTHATWTHPGGLVKRDYSGVWILVATILGSSMAVIDGAFVEAFQNVMWIAAAMAFLSALVALVAIEGRPKQPSAG